MCGVRTRWELARRTSLRHLAHPDLADCVHLFWPCETRTSTSRDFATIPSGLHRFLAITVLLDVKDIPQVGPLQWRRITGLTLARFIFFEYASGYELERLSRRSGVDDFPDPFTLLRLKRADEVDRQLGARDPHAANEIQRH